MATTPEQSQGVQHAAAPEKERRSGVVKQVLSGDGVVIRGQPKGGPPPEFTLYFSNVAAPKLARQGNQKINTSETEDEAYAWESREFLRKKIIGKDVVCIMDHVPAQAGGRQFGTLWLVEDGQQTENVVDTMVSEGLVEVKKAGVWQDERYSNLLALEEAAKAQKRGVWSTDDANEHKRHITWNIDNPAEYSQQNKDKHIKAVVEYVRDSCTVRALFLPDFSPVWVAMTGIRGPSFKQDGSKDEYAEEARFFTESRLLQRDVEIIIEGVNNTLLIGTIVHPAGSIAEALLKQGFARCVDWNITSYSLGPEKLRAAEKEAKDKKVRIWKNYESSTSNIREDERNYSAKVTEINNTDAITVKNAAGLERKIFLAGIRVPRPDEIANDGNALPKEISKDKKFRAIYDIPYVFEAREYLRKKLIGQKVDVTLDYIQSSRQTDTQEFPERHCCTVKIADTNVAEALLSKGFASIVRYRQDDEQRPSSYDALLAAEAKARTGKKGIYGKASGAALRVTDVSNDSAKAKAFLPSFQRSGVQPGIVEYIGSGSRFRIYLPKDSCIVSVILAGVTCPKPARLGPNGKVVEVDPYGYGAEALQFAKALCLQKDVQVKIDSMDKVGNFIGSIYVDGKNVAVELVTVGLGYLNYSAERTSFLSQLQAAENAAKEKKLKYWSTFTEPTDAETSKQEEDTSDRSEHFKRAMVVETNPGLKFFAQDVESGPKLEALMESIRQAFQDNPPIGGSYVPRRGDICAGRFSADNQWYRARVEGLQGGKAQVLYIDYGNRESVPVHQLAILPSEFKQLPAQATEYSLAFVREHGEESIADEEFQDLVRDTPVLVNTEYRNGNVEFALVLSAETKEDLGKRLVSEGVVLVDQRRERRFQKIMAEYISAQEDAKRERRVIWRYGDVTEDDAKEFGYSR